MVKLDQDPGPSNTLAGVMPAPLDERRPDEHWLVFGPTLVAACHARTPDVARALVLCRLGYQHRPWLGTQLTARSATAPEVKAVCSRRSVKPLKVTPKNAKAVMAVVKVLYVDDLKSDAGELR